MDECCFTVVTVADVGRLPDLVPHVASQHRVRTDQGYHAPEVPAVQEIEFFFTKASGNHDLNWDYSLNVSTPLPYLW